MTRTHGAADTVDPGPPAGRDETQRDGSGSTPSPKRPLARKHMVYFYDAPPQLAHRVAAFFMEAYRRGDGMVAIVTDVHKRIISSQLEEVGIPAARISWLDANTMAGAASDARGDVDEGLASRHLGQAVLDAARRHHGRVAVFGETVAVLCRRGRPDAALRLESFWDRFGPDVAMQILCAYPLDILVEEGAADAFTAAHDTAEWGSAVPPPETHPLITGFHAGADDWQTRALNAEVALRRQAQEQLLSREHELRERAEHQASLLRLGAVALRTAHVQPVQDQAVQEVERVTGAKVITWCGRSSNMDPALATTSCDVCIPIRTNGGLHGLMGLSGMARPLDEEQQLYLANIAHIVASAAQRAEALAQLEGERARLERVVDERTRHLVEANRELEAFNSSVSHDLRNHVRVVAGYAGLLSERHADDLSQRGRLLVGRLEHQCARMAEVIDDLLALARITRLEPARVQTDLSRLASDVAHHVQASHGDHVAWSVEPGLMANADESLMRIVLENLLGNAWKFTARSQGAKVHMGSLPGDTTAERIYYVRDNGAGFPAQAASRLFRPFYRLHGDDFPGNGMGLATVGRIVARHGGNVWAEGAEGKGATFYFTLPASQAAPKA